MKNKIIIPSLFAIISIPNVFSAGIAPNTSSLENSTLGNNSAYRLTEVSDTSILPTESFVVTKYLGDSSTGNLTAKNYLLSFNNSKINYLKWSVLDDNKKVTLNENINSSSNYILFSSYGEVGYYKNGNESQFYKYNGEQINEDFIANSNYNYGEYLNKGSAIDIQAYSDSLPITISEINGDFVANASAEAHGGGAIYNYFATINSIKGDFIGNYATNDYNEGGAIYNRSGRIGSITGNFIGNNSGYYGGAICSDSFSYEDQPSLGTIENIKGDFIGNYSKEGGAIYIDGYLETVKTIEGDFISNYAQGDYAGGGAITQSAVIENIKGDFIGNYVTVTEKSSYGIFGDGGAISNAGRIENLTGDFTGNYVLLANGISGGAGAVENASDGIGVLKGNFIANYVSGTLTTSAGGAILSVSNIDRLVGNFAKNYVKGDYALGGAIYNWGNMNSVEGNFSNNYAKGITSAQGGAIHNQSKITLNNSVFTNNYATGTDSYSTRGGAIYNTSSINYNVTSNKHIKNIGNYAEIDGVKTDSAGGFIYLHSDSYVCNSSSPSLNFNIANNSTLTIGNGTAGYDSIASETESAIINKNGLGEVVVNSSMEYYIGTLNINEGKMTINNKLGAGVVLINDKAILSSKISGEKLFTNSELTFSNNGTLELIASENLAGGSYSISAFVNPETISFGNVKTYGGTFDYATGSFVVGDAKKISLGETNPVVIEANGRVAISSASSEDTNISMNFNSVSEVTVNSVKETTNSDLGFVEMIEEITPETLLLAQAFAFDVDNLSESDTVNLSFDVGSGYAIDQFSIYHSENGNDWDIATNISNLAYDGKYLSFTVDGFSSYGFIAAVPEPAEWAAILGAIALGLAVYRRRK